MNGDGLLDLHQQRIMAFNMMTNINLNTSSIVDLLP
jgi:hypothetical protein